jgi:GH18 family chitinase
MAVPSLYLEAGLFGWSFKNKLNQIIDYLANKNVKYTNYNSIVSYDSTGNFLEVTGLTTKITPRGKDKAVEVTVSINVSCGFTNVEPALRVKRNGTIVGSGIPAGTRNMISAYGSENVGTNRMQTLNVTFIDEPQSDQELTYTVEIGQIMTSTAMLMVLNATIADSTDTSSNARASSSLILKEI